MRLHRIAHPGSTACLICGQVPCDYYHAAEGSGAKGFAECARCGQYGYGDYSDTRAAIPEGVQRAYLSCATRQASELGAPIVITADSIPSFCDLHSRPHVASNSERLLRFFGRRCRRPGRIGTVKTRDDFPVVDAEDSDELELYLLWLKQAGLISSGPYSGEPERAIQVQLTSTGWKELERIDAAQPGGKPGSCFVAMWFDTSMTGAYDLGILPAIEADCGLEALRIDRKEHNNQITDEIMAGIRNAEFMVADFTGHRSGVYYEAGFARGLGRDVIYCCREDSFKERHFDTSVISHVVWTDISDLRKKLADRIRATILPRR